MPRNHPPGPRHRVAIATSPEQQHSLTCRRLDPLPAPQTSRSTWGLTHPEVIHGRNCLLEVSGDLHGDVLIEARLHGAEGWQRGPIVQSCCRAKGGERQRSTAPCRRGPRGSGPPPRGHSLAPLPRAAFCSSRSRRSSSSALRFSSSCRFSSSAVAAAAEACGGHAALSCPLLPRPTRAAPGQPRYLRPVGAVVPGLRGARSPRGLRGSLRWRHAYGGRGPGRGMVRWRWRLRDREEGAEPPVAPGRDAPSPGQGHREAASGHRGARAHPRLTAPFSKGL